MQSERFSGFLADSTEMGVKALELVTRKSFPRLVFRAIFPPRMDKNQVADILVEIGTLLELKGENPFKTRAYANGARTLQQLSEPLDKIVAEDRLGEIKGIGEGLAKKIIEFTTQRQPSNATHWSSNTLAAELGVSRMTLFKKLRLYGLG